MTSDLCVIAHLDSLAVEPIGGFGLDGPLAWGFVERAKVRHLRIPPITPAFAPDFPLPLARHDECEPWVWRTSRAHWDVVARTATNIRRKPATGAMARYGNDRKHHLGLGPYKARDAVVPLLAARSVAWEVECTDTDELADLLAHITHLGPRHRNGHGHVARWEIGPGQPGGWRDREMPSPDGVRTAGVRAPYWHPTRRANVA